MSGARQSNRSFQFLPDDPVTDDFFGTHRRIADSIGEEIETDAKGKTIGLEGTWGSGKSSVIRMLEKRWQDKANKNFRLFTYDAWTHQGDPLRRAFLEELISCLQRGEGESWLGKCAYERPQFENCLTCSKGTSFCRPDRIRGELRLRYERNVINSEPVIKGWGLMFSIFTLMMPLGVAVFSAAKNISSSYFWVGITLMSLPFLLIVTYFVNRWRNRESAPILGDIFGKTRDTTKHTTQKTPEPTTIEFQEYYHELLQLALKSSDRKLIIVIDNLDRLECETALNVWGTMRTFLEAKGSISHDYLNRIWVIVPYDPVAIKELWSRDREGLEASYRGIVNTKNYDIAKAFTEKTFQVRYRVSAPLTSKWEDYFNQNLSVALQGQEDELSHKIFQIFRKYALPVYGLPTPRQMKMFINRIVAIAQYHYPDSANLLEIALYVALELSGAKDLNNLAISEGLENLNFTYLAGEQFRRGLAAIHYGVERGEADEVLYEPEIQQALKNGDADTLNDLLSNVAAQKVCNNYIQDHIFYMTNLTELLTAAEAFSDFTVENCQGHVRKAIVKIAEQIRNIDASYFAFKGQLQEVNSAELVHILKFAPEIIPVIRQKLSASIKQEDCEKIKPEELDNVIYDWVRATLNIQKCMLEQKGDPTIQITFGKPELYKKVLDAVAKEAPDFVRYFCPRKRTVSSYVKTFCDLSKGANFTDDTKKVISGILQMKTVEEQDARIIADFLVQECLSNQPKQLKLNYECLYENRKKTAFSESIAALASSGKVFQLLNKHNGQLTVLPFILLNTLQSQAAVKYARENSTNAAVAIFDGCLAKLAQAEAQQTAKLIYRYGLLTDICGTIDQKIKESKGFGLIIEALAKDEAMVNCISSELLISHYEIFDIHFDVDLFSELVKYLLQKDLISTLVAQPVEYRLGRLYYTAITQSDVETGVLEKKWNEQLNDSISCDMWTEMLCDRLDEYTILDLVIELKRKHYSINLKHQFVDALIEHSRKLIDPDEDVIEIEPSMIPNWGILIDALTRSERKHFREKLLELTMESDGGIEPLLQLYGSELQNALHESNSEKRKAFVHDVCVGIAEDENEAELVWMLNLFASQCALIEKADPEDQDVLRDRLETHLKEKYALVSTAEGKKNCALSSDVITSVAKMLKIDLQDEDTKDDGSGKDPNSKTEAA